MEIFWKRLKRRFKKLFKDTQKEELVEKVRLLKKEIKRKDDFIHEKNVELDALHRIWCTGCDAGAHRWSENTITKETVEIVKKYSTRLEEWYSNHFNRELEKHTPSDKELIEYFHYRIINPIWYYNKSKSHLIRDDNKRKEVTKFLTKLEDEVQNFFKSIKE